MMIVFVAILPLLGSVESDSNHGKENEVVHQQYDYKRPDFDLSQLKVSCMPHICHRHHRHVCVKKNCPV